MRAIDLLSEVISKVIAEVSPEPLPPGLSIKELTELERRLFWLKNALFIARSRMERQVFEPGSTWLLRQEAAVGGTPVYFDEHVEVVRWNNTGDRLLVENGEGERRLVFPGQLRAQGPAHDA